MGEVSATPPPGGESYPSLRRILTPDAQKLIDRIDGLGEHIDHLSKDGETVTLLDIGRFSFSLAVKDPSTWNDRSARQFDLLAIGMFSSEDLENLAAAIADSGGSVAGLMTVATLDRSKNTFFQIHGNHNPDIISQLQPLAATPPSEDHKPANNKAIPEAKIVNTFMRTILGVTNTKGGSDA